MKAGVLQFFSWPGRTAPLEQVYERALKDPDSLADVVQRPDIETFFFERIGDVAYEVYEERTGR